MPRTAGCEGHAKRSRIDLAYMEVEEAGCKGVDDDQSNRNEQE